MSPTVRTEVHGRVNLWGGGASFGTDRTLREFLGPIEEGWTKEPDGLSMPFQIVRMGPIRDTNIVAFSTLGLHRYGLPSPTSEKEIRHELVILTQAAQQDEPFPDLLFQAAMHALTNWRPFLRGDVLGPRGPLLQNSALEAFYAAPPVLLSNEFSSCQEGEHTVVIVWLVPISAGEAHYIDHHGWVAFESVLDATDSDLTDFLRRPLKI